MRYLLTLALAVALLLVTIRLTAAVTRTTNQSNGLVQEYRLLCHDHRTPTSIRILACLEADAA